MAGSDKTKYHPGISQDRRRQARGEDSETEAMIRKYMRLAEKALDQHDRENDHVPGNRLRRYFELAEICLSGKWPKVS
jgi:hypothetical protein